MQGRETATYKVAICSARVKGVGHMDEYTAQPGFYVVKGLCGNKGGLELIWKS
jgi:hypothetical protein